MLIEFRTENYRSLRDEQILTMEAGRVGEASDVRPREIIGHNEKLLPAAVVYGANASGKSNVLAAFGFMREAVLKSHRQWEPDGGVPRTPFAWGKSRNKPSMFEVTILLSGIKYCYGFVVSDDAIEEEWLFAWPNNRKQIWFERERDNFKFGEYLKGPNETVKEVTRDNTLFLSVATQHRNKQLSSIYSWFNSIILQNVTRLAPSVELIKATLRFKHILESTSIFSETEQSDLLVSRISNFLQSVDIGVVGYRNLETREGWQRIQLQHQPDNEDAWLDWDDQSEGTKAFLNLVAPVFHVFESGALLLVDELESSLHPLLGLAIVRLFNNPDTNANNAQLIFTTHDTNLLGSTLGEPPLRRDQIWFTEKDKEGATVLYPLTDYKPRKAENLERGYLQGRYGAIPFLGNINRIVE